MHKTKTILLMMLIVASLVIATLPLFTSTVTAADEWTLVNDARSMKLYPDLKEYVWQKTPNATPHGPYDQIGLHRLIQTGVTSKGVLFICPLASTSGEALVSNPPSDKLTKDENHYQAIYWANRGFDVYAMDYRTHFVPSALNASQLLFMADWGWEQWVSDIKEAVDKCKAVSGATKIFIAGYSNGAGYLMNYATKYWQEDLNGILLFSPVIYNDRTPAIAMGGNETNSYNLTKAIDDMKAIGNYSIQNFAQPALIKYATENPTGPAINPATNASLPPALNPVTNKTWANITEWWTYIIYTQAGYAPGGLSNLFAGYGNTSILLQDRYLSDKYWPNRLALECDAIVDWINCPYLAYDFDDHFKEINVPVTVFVGGQFTTVRNSTGQFLIINGLATDSFDINIIPNYGFYDIISGTYSARDVSEPAYQWMINHLPASQSTIIPTPSATPTPTPTQQPTANPTATPSPTTQPTLTSTQTISPTTTSSPTQTPKPTTTQTQTQPATPTPTMQPISTSTLAPTQSYTITPESTTKTQGFVLPTEAIYAAMVIAVIMAVAAVALVLRKRAK